MKKILSKYPLFVFLLSLFLLFVIIFVGKKMRSQDTDETTKQEVVKTVSVFTTGDKLSAPIAGEVDRADTVVLRATASGIVTRTLKAGDKVYRGKEIVKLSDTYAGTSQAGAAAAIAQRNAQFQNETANTQRDILKAEKKDLKKTKKRQARIAWKQHYLQERSVELAHDTAQLQASQAYASVALFQTVAPLSGRLEEVSVKVGDHVQAGSVVAILKASNADDVRITAHIGAERAMHVNVESEVTASYKDKTIPLEIVHLSQSGTGEESYTITFRVDRETLGEITDGSFVEINLPLQSSDDDVLIPLDSVHFSTDSAEVYVLEDTKAKLKTIELGEVIGSYIVVIDGLVSGDVIIMDRNVVDGEEVVIK